MLVFMLGGIGLRRLIPQTQYVAAVTCCYEDVVYTVIGTAIFPAKIVANIVERLFDELYIPPSLTPFT